MVKKKTFLWLGSVRLGPDWASSLSKGRRTERENEEEDENTKMGSICCTSRCPLTR